MNPRIGLTALAIDWYMSALRGLGRVVTAVTDVQIARDQRRHVVNNEGDFK